MQVTILRGGSDVDSVHDSGCRRATRPNQGLRPKPDQERDCGHRDPDRQRGTKRSTVVFAPVTTRVFAFRRGHKCGELYTRVGIRPHQPKTSISKDS